MSEGEFIQDGQYVLRRTFKPMSPVWLLGFANMNEVEKQYNRILQEAGAVDENTKKILKDETLIAVAETNRLLHWNHAEVIEPTVCDLSPGESHGVVCTTVTKNPPGDYSEPRGNRILIWNNNVYYVGHSEFVTNNGETRTFVVATYKIGDADSLLGEFPHY